MNLQSSGTNDPIVDTAAREMEYRILYIGNDSDLFKLIQKNITDLPWKFLSASSWEEALFEFEWFQPHLVISQVAINGMDGFEICKHIKEKVKDEFLPYIMIAEENSSDGFLQGIEAGADDYVAKPVDPLWLQTRIQILFRIKQKFDLLRATKERLEMLSITDGLTGVYNHRYLRERMIVEFERIRRYDGILSVAMFDLDKFKDVNDTYGHQFGDYVLKELTKVIKSLIREVDILARYGGEEFLLILPQTTKVNAGKLVERIRLKIQNHKFSNNNITMNITVSIGVATYPGDGIKSADGLIKMADDCLYKAKNEGRNRVVVARDEVNANQTSLLEKIPAPSPVP